jgi:hypothetical protein
MVSKWNSGHPETPCGKGSLLSETKLIREILPKIISRYEVSTIADVGCGDQNWIKHTDLKDAEYFGFDVEIIPGNKYRSVPEPFDLLTDILPRPFDLIMCIYVLNHLYGPGDLDKAIANFRASGSKYLLATFNDVEGFPLQSKMAIWHKEKRSGNVLRNWYYGVFEL